MRCDTMHMSTVCNSLSLLQVPLVILGDPAYPSLPWLMKPFQDTGNLTAAERTFDYRQSRARMVVENAFGRLKGQYLRTPIPFEKDLCTSWYSSVYNLGRSMAVSPKAT